MEKQIKQKERLFLFFMIFLFVFIRNIHFSEFLNFSHDQGKFSSEALNIYRHKSFILIGPSISFNLGGHEIFQGSVIYYFFLIFLLLGGFDPVKSSFIFMLFASIMIIPLFYGMKRLAKQKSAVCLTMLYTIFPFYINYTRFLWNPNFQFVLLPVLIYLMGLFKTKKHILILFFIGLYAGFVLQFHYQFILIILGLIVYYFVIKRYYYKYALLFIIGFCIGFSPLILFDIRHNFYNLRMLILFATSIKILSANFQPFTVPSYYFLSISFFVFIFLFSIYRKYITNNFLFALFGILFIFSGLLYLPKPAHAFGMPDGWNYPMEKKVNKIITGKKLDNFNIVNLLYDTDASVQKYLLEKDAVIINAGDYYHNEYLYVISGKEDYKKTIAYEVTTFKPSTIVQKWKLNNTIDLLLLKRYHAF